MLKFGFINSAASLQTKSFTPCYSVVSVMAGHLSCVKGHRTKWENSEVADSANQVSQDLQFNLLNSNNHKSADITDHKDMNCNFSLGFKPEILRNIQYWITK